MPGTTSEPSVALSCTYWFSISISSQLIRVLVANNFWGKDDAGVAPMLQRMHDAKTTMEELKAFYTGTAPYHRCASRDLTIASARAALEDEFARKLLGLSKK